MQQQSNKQIAMHVSVISIVWNMILSAFKLLAGIIAHSNAMISDAVHSASDVFSTIIVMIGVNISSKERDADHPYGHERFESLAAIILAAVLLATGLGIGYVGVCDIIGGHYADLAIPGILALVAAVLSIAVKEAMYHYTVHYAKQIHSDALKADAWHHRSDALSSIGSLVGILGARLGWPVLDAVASVVICLFILKASVSILRDAISKLIDRACDPKVEEAIAEEILAVPDVLGLDDLRTRMFGPKIYVDVEIMVDGDLSLVAAHHIAENVHDKVERDFPEVKHCMVHVNPVGAHDHEEGELNEYESR